MPYAKRLYETGNKSWDGEYSISIQFSMVTIKAMTMKMKLFFLAYCVEFTNEMFQVIILSLVSLLEQTLVNAYKIPILKGYKYLLKSLCFNNFGGIDMIWK